MTTYIEDVANDYLHWEDPECVTVRYIRKAGDSTDTIEYGQRVDVSRVQREFSGVNISGESIAWNLPAALLTCGEPKIDDTITDSDEAVWTIRSVQKVRFSTQFLCLTEKQR